MKPRSETLIQAVVCATTLLSLTEVKFWLEGPEEALRVRQLPSRGKRVSTRTQVSYATSIWVTDKKLGRIGIPRSKQGIREESQRKASHLLPVGCCIVARDDSCSTVMGWRWWRG